MKTLLPGARLVTPANTSPSSFIDVPWKVCLHTTEGGGNQGGAASYHGHQSYPHFEVQDGVPITQFFPIDVAAKALYNGPGGAETNRSKMIQIEIVGRAANAANFTDALLNKVAEIIRFVHEQTGMAVQAPVRFYGAGEGIVLAHESSPIRIWGDELEQFEGILGHQHVGDGNDHWDPGAINIDRIIALAGGPSTSEEDDMTPDQSAKLDSALTLCQSTNIEVGKLAVVVRDDQTGLGVRVSNLETTISGLAGAVQALANSVAQGAAPLDVNALVKNLLDEQARRQLNG